MYYERAINFEKSNRLIVVDSVLTSPGPNPNGKMMSCDSIGCMYFLIDVHCKTSFRNL